MYSPAVALIECPPLWMLLENGSGSGLVPIATLMRRGRPAIERATISFIVLISRLTISGCYSHGCPSPRERPEHVVGERKRQQHGAGLVLAAHRQPAEPHAARPGIGAFGLRAFACRGFCRVRSPCAGASPPPPAGRRGAARRDRCRACCAPAACSVRIRARAALSTSALGAGSAGLRGCCRRRAALRQL